MVGGLLGPQLGVEPTEIYDIATLLWGPVARGTGGEPVVPRPVSKSQRIGSSVVRLSLFIVVTIAAFALLATTISNTRFGEKSDYAAVFTDVTGLIAGDDVRIAGVRVGEITNIEVAGNSGEERKQALVHFTVDRTVVLTEGTTALIRYRNLIGQRYLSLAQEQGSSSHCRSARPSPLPRAASTTSTTPARLLAAIAARSVAAASGAARTPRRVRSARRCVRPARRSSRCWRRRPGRRRPRVSRRRIARDISGSYVFVVEVVEPARAVADVHRQRSIPATGNRRKRWPDARRRRSRSSWVNQYDRAEECDRRAIQRPVAMKAGSSAGTRRQERPRSRETRRAALREDPPSPSCQPALEQRVDRVDAVDPAHLLAFVRRARVVGDRDFDDAAAGAEQPRGQLGLDVEADAAQPEALAAPPCASPCRPFPCRSAGRRTACSSAS